MIVDADDQPNAVEQLRPVALQTRGQRRLPVPVTPVAPLEARIMNASSDSCSGNDSG